METETFLHDWTGQTDAPVCLVKNRVRQEWVDEYDHLNMAHYLTICDQANWAFWNWVNHPVQTIRARNGHEYVIVENHVTYVGELPVDAQFHITTQLTAMDEKRMLLFHKVWDARNNSLAATNEVKCLGFNLAARKIEPWQPIIRNRLQEVLATHKTLGVPDGAGQGIALRRA